MAVDVGKLLQQAHSAIERRNYDLAIFKYKQTLMLQPDHIEAREKLRASQTKKHTQEGGNAAVSLLKALPPFVKAKVFTILGKTDAALTACEDALTAKPDLVGAMKVIAKNAVKEEKWELAAWQLREILNKHDPDNAAIMEDLVDVLEALGETQEAIELCERIREADPSADIDPRIRELAAGQTATVFANAASRGAHSAVKDEDERRELEIESQIARTDEARDIKIAALRKKLDERPDDYRILLRIGDEYANYDDFEAGFKKAKEAYQQAHEIMPSDHNVQAKLGEIEIKRLNREVRALQEKAKASGDEADKQAYIEALKKMRRYQIEEYENRVHNQPLRVDYRHTLGKLYQDTKQYDKAIAEFQQSCKDPKFSVEAYTAMGQCFTALDQVDVAIDMYHKALDGQEIFSKIRDTVFWLGDALERNGEKEEALKQYSRVFEDDITYKDVRQRVERLRLELRDAKRARREADGDGPAGDRGAGLNPSG